MKKIFFCMLLALGSLALNAQTKKPVHGKTATMGGCVMMDGGKMMSVRSGGSVPMQQDLTLKNGTVVSTDGTVRTRDGKTVVLKDGDCVWTNGKITHLSKNGKM